MSEEAMTFGQAVKEMRAGGKVAREGWNGKGMFLFAIADWDFTTDVGGVDEIETDPFVCMKTAGDTLIPWLASQADILAEDWQAV